LTAEPAVNGVKLSGCPPVFVNQAAEDIDAFDACGVPARVLRFSGIE
jgi:hypothetical protein